MTRPARVGVATAALVVLALLSGCADATPPGGGASGGPGDDATHDDPTSRAEPEPSAPPSSPAVSDLAAGEHARGLPDGVEPDPDAVAGAGWMPRAGLLYVVTFGSGSCPRTGETPAVRDDASDAGEAVAVTFREPAADTMCTMDYVPTTSVVAVPDGVDPAAPLTVRLGDEGTLEVRPRPEAGAAGPAAWLTP